MRCRTAAAALLLALLPGPALAQATPSPSPMDHLVTIALRENPSYRARVLGIASAEAAQRQTKGMHLPTATLNSRYTELAGNTVNLGDLINPAFNALNQLLQQPAFPTNLDLQLPLRQETALRVAMPVYQASLRAASRAADARVDLQQAQVDAAAQDLAAEVRATYLGLSQLRVVVAIHDSTLQLLDEHVRFAERLVANGTATPDAVLRARAEQSEMQQQRDDYAQRRDAAAAGLNVLLNRPIATNIPADPDAEVTPAELEPLEEALRLAHARRHDLRALDHARRASDAMGQLARSSFLPSLAVAVDYGVQGRDYRFNASNDYTALTFVASWNLFNGGQDRQRVEQAQLESRQLDLQREGLSRAVDLQVTNAWNAARVALGAIRTAEARLTSARRTFELVRRRHELGAASQLEFLDARVAFTAAQLNLVSTRYDARLRRVALERAANLVDIPSAAR